jgi:uncharacterized cupredoxin-like copper-binding protein
MGGTGSRHARSSNPASIHLARVTEISYMRPAQFAFAVMAGIAAVASGAGSAHAAATIKVELQDSLKDADLKGMQMKLDHDSVNAGPVRFEVTNESKSLVHEMIVLKTDMPASQLPYDQKKDPAIESKLKSLGEVSELPPGNAGSLTLRMKPGKYLLFCNQAGDLHGGMWSNFTVTDK